MSDFETTARMFLITPEELTDEMIGELRRWDDRLGERAILKRREALTAAATARHQAAMGQPRIVPKATAREELASVVIDHVLLWLAEPRQRLKALEASNRELRQRCDELERRCVFLEAERAVQAD